MTPVDIANKFYFFHYPLEAVRRVERVAGILHTVCSYQNITVRNMAVLMWAGLFEENYKGELEHAFPQSKDGLNSAIGMMNALSVEKKSQTEAMMFMFLAAQKALEDDGWYGKPTDTAPSSKPEEVVELHSEHYFNLFKEPAFGLCNLGIPEFENLTPAQFYMFLSAKVANRDIAREFLDIEFAALKSVLLATVGGDVNAEDLRLIAIAKQVESVKAMPDEESVNVFKQWVTVSGGKTR